MTESSSSVDLRGRPRSRDLDDRILTATRELLIAHGYAGTTVDAVAAAASCGKSAIYRRWPGKAELVVAAVKQLQSARDLPDTGSLRGDLVECALHYARNDDQASLVLARLLTEIGTDPELFQVAFQGIGGPPVAALVAVMRRWQERGDVRADAPVELIARVVPSIAFGNVTLQQRALEPGTVEQLVDEVLMPALAAR